MELEIGSGMISSFGIGEGRIVRTLEFVKKKLTPALRLHLNKSLT